MISDITSQELNKDSKPSNTNRWKVFFFLFLSAFFFFFCHFFYWIIKEDIWNVERKWWRESVGETYANAGLTPTFGGEGRLGQVEETQPFAQATHLLNEIADACKKRKTESVRERNERGVTERERKRDTVHRMYKLHNLKQPPRCTHGKFITCSNMWVLYTDLSSFCFHVQIIFAALRSCQ